MHTRAHTCVHTSNISIPFIEDYLRASKGDIIILMVITVYLWHLSVPSLTYQLSPTHDFYHWHRKNKHVHVTRAHPDASMFPLLVHQESAGFLAKAGNSEPHFPWSSNSSSCVQSHTVFLQKFHPFLATTIYQAGLKWLLEPELEYTSQNLLFSLSVFTFPSSFHTKEHELLTVPLFITMNICVHKNGENGWWNVFLIGKVW